MLKAFILVPLNRFQPSNAKNSTEDLKKQVNTFNPAKIPSSPENKICRRNIIKVFMRKTNFSSNHSKEANIRSLNL